MDATFRREIRSGNRMPNELAPARGPAAWHRAARRGQEENLKLVRHSVSVGARARVTISSQSDPGTASWSGRSLLWRWSAPVRVQMLRRCDRTAMVPERGRCSELPLRRAAGRALYHGGHSRAEHYRRGLLAHFRRPLLPSAVSARPKSAKPPFRKPPPRWCSGETAERSAEIASLDTLETDPEANSLPQTARR